MAILLSGIFLFLAALSVGFVWDVPFDKGSVDIALDDRIKEILEEYRNGTYKQKL